MPIKISSTTGGAVYGDPFIGPIDRTLQIKLDVSTLTTDEVDEYGFLKPNVPLTIDGDAVTVAVSSPAAAVANDDNTGNGTVGSLAGKAGGVSEVITLTATGTTNFEVRGSRSGVLGDATVGTPYTSSVINLTITAGGTPFAAGDVFTIVITGVSIYGVTVAPIKIVDPDPTNSTLGADTSDPFVAVAVDGVINRDIAEDNLGRAFTAAELAAFADSKFTLTKT